MRNSCVKSNDFLSESDSFVAREKVKAVISLESSFVSASYARFLNNLETEHTTVSGMQS